MPANSTAAVMDNLVPGYATTYRVNAVTAMGESLRSANTVTASTGTEDTSGWYKVKITQGMTQAYASWVKEDRAGFGEADTLKIEPDKQLNNSTTESTWVYASSWQSAVWNTVGSYNIFNGLYTPDPVKVRVTTNGGGKTVGDAAEHSFPLTGYFKVGTGAEIAADGDVDNFKLPANDTVKYIALEDSYGEIDRDYDDFYWKVETEFVTADLGFNNADSEKDVPSPDVDFIIDDTDDKYEDEGDGVSFWWSNGSEFTRYDLVDTLPFRVDFSDMDESDRGSFEYRLRADGFTGDAPLKYYDAVSTAGDRLAYLGGGTLADQQLQQAPRQINAGGSEERDVDSDTSEFLLRAFGSGKVAGKLHLEMKGPDGVWGVADSVNLTLRDVGEYYAIWSSRGTEQSPSAYPIEDGRIANIKQFPAAHYVGPTGDDVPGVLRTTDTEPVDGRDVFIFVHGYNVTEEFAGGIFSETFKRMFWTGFRGSFVGYTWTGDEYDILPGSGERALFDPNVYNAFQSAPSFRDFLTGPVRDWSGQDATRVNVMAHSLGNLVMFEGLRLAELSAAPNTKLVNNTISVEAAIWKEAFEPETDLTYPSNGYTVQSWLDNTTYTIDEQKHHSWRFWFRQIDDATGQERNLKRLVSGTLFNSYNPNDFALVDGMRLNDHLMRSGGAGHYWRSLTHANYRTLSDSVLINDSMERIPSLMGKRTLVYGDNDLNLPLGTGHSPYFVPIAARNFGWPETSHGAAFYKGDTENGIWGGPEWDVSMPVMWEWYQEVFHPNQQGAVTLGN